MRDSALKRHNDWKKAIRKKNISEHVYGLEYYNNLHQYSKNKIHCSCLLCSGKTNTDINKSKGPVCHYHKNIRIPCTNDRYGRKNYKFSDKIKIERLNSSLEDYYRGEYVNEAV